MSDEGMCVVEIPLTRQEMRLVSELTAGLSRRAPAELVREALGFPAEPPPAPGRADAQGAADRTDTQARTDERSQVRAKPGALRARLLAELAVAPRSGQQLAESTRAVPATLRYNLMRLQRTGVIDCVGEGPEALYCLIDRAQGADHGR